jgi:hypothetical protein
MKDPDQVRDRMKHIMDMMGNEKLSDVSMMCMTAVIRELLWVLNDNDKEEASDAFGQVQVK